MKKSMMSGGKAPGKKMPGFGAKLGKMKPGKAGIVGPGKK